MITNSLTHLKDLLHAKLCYQAFITPIHMPLEKKYRDFAKMACEYIEVKRSEVIHHQKPRHYVIHHFSPRTDSRGKKILISHGWVSRAAYMVKFIKTLHEEGYDVYALDFPAHGEARGVQLPWPDAITILKDTINNYGPFHAVIGHSFGGSMLLSTLTLAGRIPQWQLEHKPDRAILIASPTQMRSPINSLAKRFKLTQHGYLHLRELIQKESAIDPSQIHVRHFISQTPDIPVLCIHGEQDDTVAPKESMIFCKQYPHARLSLLPDADHVSVLMDKRVEQLVCHFLDGKIIR